MLIDDDDDVSYRRCVCLSVCPSVTNPLRQMNVISCGFHRQVVLRLVFKQILYGGSQTRINFLVFFFSRETFNCMSLSTPLFYVYCSVAMCPQLIFIRIYGYGHGYGHMFWISGLVK